ncbi:adenosine receptor A3-like [Actinia tenebrosa]|uniref:Adenosine receptor A3-like n=1 Tax=Actinia tenebrosa TaxID=6105 RepID=A0A6P8INW8_ACTTE|nr:adenosine receptor A3-like [Actinia tenebrosa]
MKCSYLEFVFRPEIYASTFYVFLAVTHVLCGIVSSGLNSLVIWTIWKVPALHKPSMVLIAGLALKDLCMGIMVEPLYTAWIITAHKAESFELFCALGVIGKDLLYSLSTLAGFNITAISIDRCLAIRTKANYRNIVTLKRVVRFLIFCWISSFTICIPLAFESKRTAFRVVAVLGVIFFVVSKTSYILSILAIRKLRNQVSQKPEVHAESAERKANFDISKYSRSLRTLVIVFCCDVVFYCPLISIGIFRSIGAKISENNWALYLSVCEMLMLLPSTVNPCIFLWRMQDLRQEAKNILKGLLKRGET